MKRNIISLLSAIVMLTTISSCCNDSGYGYKMKDGMIVYNTPERPADQKSVIGLTAAPMETVRIGIIGLGMRGPSAVDRFTYIEGADIVAICDLYPEKLAPVQDLLERRGKARAAEYSGEDGWKEMCLRDDVDLVYIVTPWLTHTPMAVFAMEHGKHVAVEVPAATSVEECWQLVNTAEKTQRHCMMLENCVYDFFELTTLNMAQEGLFGEVIHAEGAYIHNLDPYWAEYQDNWRLLYNRKHRGDVYATHGMGPACQVLNIHRGDKMNLLVSMDTDAFNGKKVAEHFTGSSEYANGDHTTTLIRTEKGKTIEMQHNVVTPRPYNRMYQVEGTEGFANKYPNEGFALRTKGLDGESYVSDEIRNAIMVEYQHPITREGTLVETAKRVGGHGGMDFIMDYRLIYCLRNGLPLDQDVYDAAEWSCIGELSRVSIENGSMPVVMPDFTRGDWNRTDGLRLALKKH
ncbi:MAG: Gfo/Idh/MocA family oxidoreductase [Bacteroidales bacterium]|nr:Gfo/Idh/MocA family oxidoreductase [Bacteroidales bacterium]